MKVTVEREFIPLDGKGYFYIKADGKLIKVVAFRINVDEQSIYYEETNRREALEIAKKLEQLGSIEPVKGVIYSSEDNKD